MSCRKRGRPDPAEVRDPRAWLSAATVRLSLDALRKARARRETYVGPWLPEPILPDDMRALAADATASRAELASDLSLALLHVLERLSPEERAAFILHDAFDCDYPTIARTLEKSEQACRKLVSRARERVKADRPRHSVTKEHHRALVEKSSPPPPTTIRTRSRAFWPATSCFTQMVEAAPQRRSIRSMERTRSFALA